MEGVGQGGGEDLFWGSVKSMVGRNLHVPHEEGYCVRLLRLP